MDGTCNFDGECKGWFAVYGQSVSPEGFIRTEFQNEKCIVDTSADNSYFNNYHEDYKGKIYVCVKYDPNKHLNQSSYLKRVMKDDKYDDAHVGIWGKYINKEEVDDPLEKPMKYNTVLKFSDASLRYNPI